MKSTIQILFSIFICFLALLMSGLIISQTKATNFGPASYNSNCRVSAEVANDENPPDPIIVLNKRVIKNLESQPEANHLTIINGSVELRQQVLIAY